MVCRHVVEHGVHPVVRSRGVKVLEQHALFEAFAVTVRIPPRVRWWPRWRRLVVARVEGRKGREETVGEGARNEREVVRRGPVEIYICEKRGMRVGAVCMKKGARWTRSLGVDRESPTCGSRRSCRVVCSPQAAYSNASRDKNLR